MKKISLAAKIYVFVLIPVAIQVVSIFAFINIHNQSIKQVQALSVIEKLSTLLNELSFEVGQLTFLVNCQKPGRDQPPDMGKFIRLSRSIDNQLRELETVGAANPEIVQTVQEARNLKNQVIEKLIAAQNPLLNGSAGDRTKEALTREVSDLLFQGVDSLLPKIIAQQRLFSAKAPSINNRLREEEEQLIIAACLSELVVSLVIAFAIARSVIWRINRLHEKTRRIASDLPLDTPDRGNDELSQLDQTLHELDVNLRRTKRRETLFIENAFDIILSFDQTGRILSANHAVGEAFGLEPAGLTGMRMAELVAKESQEAFSAAISDLKSGPKSKGLELQLIKADGSPVDALISLQWLPNEGCFYCIIHDISEQRKADRLRKDTLAMLSHDLKTPLSNVENSINLIFEAESAEKRNSYADMARRNIQRMLQLVADFVDIEKIESKMYLLDKSSFDIHDMLAVVVDEVSALAQKKGVQVLVEPVNMQVFGDLNSLVRVTTNLAGNAVHYTDKGGKVSIGCKKKGSFAEVYVSDQGRGMPPGAAEKIFEKYYQLPNEKKPASSGLGLAICKHLAELNGGTIAVESIAGKGSTFLFTVPLV